MKERLRAQVKHFHREFPCDTRHPESRDGWIPLFIRLLSDAIDCNRASTMSTFIELTRCNRDRARVRFTARRCARLIDLRACVTE